MYSCDVSGKNKVREQSRLKWKFVVMKSRSLHIQYLSALIMVLAATGCSNDLAANAYTCLRNSDCGTGFYCETTRGVCLPNSGQADAGGMGDCRQASFACATGFSCQEVESMWICLPGGISDSDAMTVNPADCDDGEMNGNETDVDCGGDCSPCETGEMCGLGSDCISQVCAANICAAPTCTDGILNGSELAIDCGGDCGPCPLGSPCEGDTDCESNVCDNGTCVEANCEDGRANGSESGVDCGGDCPPCGAGDPCNESSDCASRNCVDGVCLGPTCMDGIRNGEESGVDCGVVCGVGCPDGTPCDLGTDCLSGVCVMGACAPPECGDGTVNGEETCDDNDIDTDACPTNCLLSTRGDGFVWLAKNNDDGNREDPCCTKLAKPCCGDGIVGPMKNDDGTK